MDSRPKPGTLSAGKNAHLEELLDTFQGGLDPSDPVHRSTAQLGNLTVQILKEYSQLLSEADAHLPRDERDRVVPPHRNRALEALSRLVEILDIQIQE